MSAFDCVLSQAPRLKGCVFKVYVVLTDAFEQSDGACVEISLPELSRRAGCSRASVAVAVNRLDEQGLVLRFGARRGGTNRYELPTGVRSRSWSDPVQNLAVPRPEIRQHPVQELAGPRPETTPYPVQNLESPNKERALQQLQPHTSSSKKEESERESSGGERAAMELMIREVFGFGERDTHRVIERIQKAAAEACVDLIGLRTFFEEKLDSNRVIYHARALCTFTESDLLPWATQKMRKPPTRAYQRTEPPREATPGEDERTEALVRETLAYERQILQRAAGGQR